MTPRDWVIFAAGAVAGACILATLTAVLLVTK